MFYSTEKPLKQIKKLFKKSKLIVFSLILKILLLHNIHTATYCSFLSSGFKKIRYNQFSHKTPYSREQYEKFLLSTFYFSRSLNHFLPLSRSSFCMLRLVSDRFLISSNSYHHNLRLLI